MNYDDTENNIGKQDDNKDSVNLFRTIYSVLALIGHSTELHRQATTNTPTAPSIDCYFELIDEIRLEDSTSQVTMDIPLM